ncbi:acyl-CoA thioesterase [Salinibacter grassmerensis]|uniref:acyl-CoA thioesterase n=1 Tax=Salinibacter grassmerensis TaxID=3040353 RepID=UPI0021E94BDE|nr:acyl-CoA thioesterase [Salinibacter grassmerensis]
MAPPPSPESRPAAVLDERAETRIVHAVFPGDTNHYHTLFGGTALEWMDQAAFICATRWCREKVVTVRTSEIEYKHPVSEGTIVELIARVAGTGTTSLTVRVDMFIEPMDEHDRTLACDGQFTLVALDDQDDPTPVPTIPSAKQDEPSS